MGVKSFKHYIKIDAKSRIISGWSIGASPYLGEDGICVNADGAYQFEISGVANPPLYTTDGIPIYRWDGSQVVKRTDTEIEADRANISPPTPSETEKLRSDVDYLSMMTGVDLPNQEVMA